ncbi:MAG: glycosyltransferase family 4 protein [Sedimentisphaerales bacterium]|nr:glycosyltransferase family 4 protein [Sedimentisphaerales bacterium]
MRITFVLPGSGPSGGVRATVIVANGLIERGHQVRLLVYSGKTGLRSIARKTLTAICYPRTSSWLSQFRGPKKPFSDIGRCDFSDFEIVIGAGLWSCAEISRLSSNKIRKVHYVHGISPQEPELMERAWREKAPKIAVSSYLEEKVQQVCGQKLFAIIPNGVSTSEYFSSVAVNERDGVGTIYANTYHKDPATILAVFEGLRTKYPRIRQRAFGACRPDGKMRGFVEYHRLPSLEQARDLYSRSIVWFCASRSEGFGLPILEAMACGCAVVSTDCGGSAPDIIEDGVNGFLTKVGDANDIINKIAMLLQDSRLRERIVDNSGSTVCRFTWQNTIDKLEAALSAIAGA